MTISILVLNSCGPFRKNRQPKVPPPAAPVEAADPKPAAEKPAEPPEQASEPVSPPPEIEAAGPEVGAPPPLTAPEALPPPPPTATPSVRKKSTPAPAPKPEPPEEPATAEGRLPAVPALTQLLSKQEQWEYNREIDERLLRIHETVDLLATRPLAGTQMELLDRIRAFVKQTVETRKTDLVTARSLVRRADLLTRDLEESTR